jgi:hypothetical protein
VVTMVRLWKQNLATALGLRCACPHEASLFPPFLLPVTLALAQLCLRPGFPYLHWAEELEPTLGAECV